MALPSDADYSYNSATTATETLITAGTSLFNQAEGKPEIYNIVRGKETFSKQGTVSSAEILTDSVWYQNISDADRGWETDDEPAEEPQDNEPGSN